MHPFRANLHLVNTGPPLDEKDEIDGCRLGDRRAQRQFYARYAGWVLGICLRYLEDRDEAEDAMIRSMFSALTRIRSLRDPRAVRPWLKRIAVNECLMILRQKPPLSASWEEVEVAVPAKDLTSQNPEMSDLLQLIARLPEGYRTVFNLYVLDGYTHKEIGEMLGISLHTSKSQLLMARRKLARWLGHPLNPSENETDPS